MGKGGIKLGIAGAMVMAVIFNLAGCSEKKESYSPENPTSVVVWTYYKGKQMDMLEGLISEFNGTIGAEKGIVVTAETKGDINELAKSIDDSIQGKIGADDLPDVFSSYLDTAIMYKDEMVNLRDYFTEEELKEFVPGFLDQGGISDGEELYILPVAKSTELLYLNETDWEPFAKETGVSLEDLQTWEGLADVAEKYYDWSGGKAFCGRDAAANYMLVGAAQLGNVLFEKDQEGNVVFQGQEETMRRLWETGAVPYIKGYYANYGKFRSDDMKTGDLIAYVGSSSSVAYFPKEVTRADGTTYEIEGKVYQVPNFQGTDPYAVQQGAGMGILKSEEKDPEAAAEFLKWFTQVKVNTEFCIHSGYFPVQNQANTVENMNGAMKTYGIDQNSVAGQSIRCGIEQINGSELYMQQAYIPTEARSVLGSALSSRLETYREEFSGIPEDQKEKRLEEMYLDWLWALQESLM